MAEITVWRIVAAHYADQAFSGEGAERHGGRFNSRGHPAVYTAQSISLALLEMLVQANLRHRLKHHVCISATFDDAEVEDMERDSLPKGWDSRPYSHTSQSIGDIWLNEERSLALRVSSVVNPYEYNYVMNPRHANFDALQTGRPLPAPFDPRLIDSSI